MSKRANPARSKGTSAVSPKRTLKQLFEKRDRARPGSKEEEKAAENILVTLFPDTNAG